MSRNYQPGVATKVTSARELLECLGGVDPGLDDGTPAQAPVHRTFDGSEAEVQFLIDNYKREFPDTHRSGAGLRIIATAPGFPTSPETIGTSCSLTSNRRLRMTSRGSSQRSR